MIIGELLIKELTLQVTASFPKTLGQLTPNSHQKLFSVFIRHVIKTENRNRSIIKFKNLGYDR